MDDLGTCVGSEVSMPAGASTLQASLRVPWETRGVVLFAHGSGSSRFSPRNRSVAEHLAHVGFATVLADLLTPDEEAIDRRTAHLRFNIAFLAERLHAVATWLLGQPELGPLPKGFFGASTGAAAALVAAAAHPETVQAVVSRGGRPDLAGASLPLVRAPTLLLVGSRDTEVLALNEQALTRLSCPKQLIVVNGASHLFEEPGTLEVVADAAARWFDRHLRIAPLL